MKKTTVVSIFFAAALLNACAADINSDSYAQSAVGEVSSVDEGVVIDVRTVSIQGNESGFGTLAGAAAGGFAGSAIGRGKGSVLAAVGGALAGAFLGDFTQKELTEQDAFQYFVKLRSGKVISVIQGKKDPLSVGQRVLVIYGRTTKLIPDTASFQ